MKGGDLCTGGKGKSLHCFSTRFMWRENGDGNADHFFFSCIEKCNKKNQNLFKKILNNCM